MSPKPEPDERRRPPEPGRLLDGRYRLGTVLGRGGSATVHEATDVLLGRTVAVKVCRPGAGSAHPHRFAAEARLLAGLSHPGLVTVYDVRLAGERPYLVMRLVRGATLRDLLDHGPLDPASVARHGARLAAALAHVHAHDIAHRDLKPANVLVDESDDCYLADFGIARALGTPHLTASGELVGTAAYLAPEQVTDTDAGPPADVYALGLVLLECLTGRPEFTGTTVEAAFARLARAPRIPEDLPPAWRSVLRAMTATGPRRRPDAARCAELLTAIARDGGRERPVRPGPARPRAARVAVLALSAVTAVLVAAGPTTLPDHPTAEPPPAADGPERAPDRAAERGRRTDTTTPAPGGTGRDGRAGAAPSAREGGVAERPDKDLAEPPRGPGADRAGKPARGEAGHGSTRRGKAATKTTTKTTPVTTTAGQKRRS